MSLGSDYLNKAILKYNLNDPWDCVELFENKIASFCGSKYAISTDCCTHAIFLSLKFLNKTNTKISLPVNTYISLPSVINMAGYNFEFVDSQWQDSYYLEPLNVIDSATCLKKNMYIDGTLTCVSFHFRKILPIGRGGMILTNSKNEYDWLCSKRYDGRNMRVKYDEDIFKSSGYHMYMTPEQCAYGIYLFDQNNFNTIEKPNYKGYKSLKKFSHLFD